MWEYGLASCGQDGVEAREYWSTRARRHRLSLWYAVHKRCSSEEVTTVKSLYARWRPLLVKYVMT
jgi:hypothetical protein